MDGQNKITFLQFLPVSLFGGVMALCGLCFSFRLASAIGNRFHLVAETVGFLAIFFFILLALLYIAKWWKYPEIVTKEFKHPVGISFFGTIIISLLLIPGIILPYSVTLAIVIWLFGTILMFFFTCMVLRRWIDAQQDPGNAVPAWIIPVVGTLDVPIIGMHLPLDNIHEVCLFFYSIGIVFTIVLFTLIFSRLLFSPPMPEVLQPTYFILVGPFALAFSGYIAFTNQLDIIASLFYFFDLFLFLLIGSKLWLLPKCCPFRISWWAVSFPMVAITIAAFRFARYKESPIFSTIAFCLLLFSTIIICYLLVQTIYRSFTSQMFLKEPAAEKIIASIHHL